MAAKLVLSPMAMGRALRDARRARRWTQKALAERSGVAQPTISNVERGASAVGLATLFRLLASLELELLLQPRTKGDLADAWQLEASRG